MDSKVNVSEKSSYLLNTKVNGKVLSLNVDPSRRLVDVIRSDLQLTGTKISCEMGRCGACMVLIDGKQQNACLTMAYQCENKEIQTIEGVCDEKTELIQRAFLEEGGFQCGYCTPGMVISIKAMLEENPKPSFEVLKEGLTGNLCRCTGYGGIYRVLRRLSCSTSR